MSKKKRTKTIMKKAKTTKKNHNITWDSAVLICHITFYFFNSKSFHWGGALYKSLQPWQKTSICCSITRTQLLHTDGVAMSVQQPRSYYQIVLILLSKVVLLGVQSYNYTCPSQQQGTCSFKEKGANASCKLSHICHLKDMLYNKEKVTYL